MTARAAILIVDDEPDILEIVTSHLRDFDVFAAADGTAALRLLEARRCDLMITDIRMPGMSGLDLAHEVYRRHPATKILVLTGHSDASNRPDFVQEWMTKPFRLSDLRSAVERILGPG